MRKIVLLLAVVFLLQGCNSIHTSSPEPHRLLDSAGASSFITKDQKGNPVIGYVSFLNDSVSLLKFRISYDGGEKFSVLKEVTVSDNIHPHGENLPKLCFRPDGSIFALWGAENSDPRNIYAGKLYYSQSFDGGNSWEERKMLVNDSASYDQRYADLALLPDGEVAVLWLDSRESKEQEGSSVFFARTDGHKGLGAETRIDESICPCCRTDLFVDDEGIIHACFRDIIQDSIRDMVYTCSKDGGKSFDKPVRISADNWVIRGCPHTGPTMGKNKNGLQFSWYTGDESAGVYYTSMRNSSFAERDSVSGHSSAKHPQLITLNESPIIVWDETIKAGENFNSRVGLQQRNQKGKIMKTRYLTADTLVCEFPAVLPLQEKVLVSYTRKNRGSSSVWYTIAKP